MPAGVLSGSGSREERPLRKRETRSNVARQSAMAGKLSTNQRSEFCTWLKAPTTIIRPPMVSLPEKKPGTATRIGTMIASQP